MKLSEELTWRGFVNQTTFADSTELDTQKRTFYLGVEPSAKSMHIGHLAMLKMFSIFMKHGYTPVLLVGGATGLVGDPDGKAQERDLKTKSEVAGNANGIVAQYRRFFGDDLTVVDNYSWFQDMGYLDFLRDVGKQFSMTQLLDRDFIKQRIGEGGSGISYAEFSYSLIQGYDFLHLYREHGVTLQIAGADQWGNSISGVQLIRKLEGADAHIWTAPLVINKRTGKKFGKSEGGALWLDPELTSPYEFYQYLLNTDDDALEGYFGLFTDLEQSEIADVINEHMQSPHKRVAQKKLAYEVTAFVHGADVTDAVISATAVLFGAEAIQNVDESVLAVLRTQVPTHATGSTLVEVLVATEVAASNGEARRLLKGNAISVNGVKQSADMPLDTLCLLKKGKNTFILVE